MKNEVVLVSSMYPSITNPRYGIFVSNIERLLKSNGINIGSRIVIKSKVASGSAKGLRKVKSYLVFYLNLSVRIIFNSKPIYYIHFPTTVLPVLSLLRWAGIRRKYILNFHGTDILSASDKQIHQFVKLAKDCLLYITPSEFLGNELKKRLQPDIKVIHSPSGGVDLTIFKPNYSKSHKYDFIFVSRINDQKGWKIALFAFKKLLLRRPNLKMLFVGSGRDESKLKSQLQGEENIDWLSSTEQRKLPDIYASGRWLVFPSLYEESLALVPIESMATGTPVICTNRGAPKYYIHNNVNGLVGEPTIEEFYGLMSKASELSLREYEMYQAYAMSTAHDYCSDKVGKELAAEFKQVM